MIPLLVSDSIESFDPAQKAVAQWQGQNVAGQGS
jgi:hypothetical protein